MVDDHFGGVEGVDFVRVAAEGFHCFTHGGEVDDAGHTGEVLHEDAGGGELDFDAGFGGGVPAGDGLDVVCGDIGTVFGAEEVFPQHFQRIRQFLHAGYGAEGEIVVGFIANPQCTFGIEGVLAISHEGAPIL